MKTRLPLLLLLGLGSCAQTPPATPDHAAATKENLMRQEVRRIAASTNAPDNPAVTPAAPPAAPTGSQPTPTPPSTAAAAPTPPPVPRVVPSPAASGAPPPPVAGAVAPPAGRGNAPAEPEEMLPPGLIDFRDADIGQVLDIYSRMVNRTMLRANLPAVKISLTTRTALTTREAIQALDTMLALNGIAIIPVGDKFIKVVPQTQAFQEGAAFTTNSEASLPDSGQFLSQIIQLKYAKPSEMGPLLASFAKIPNSLFPIDSSQILVIRDYTENVKRMLEIIKEVDVIVPSEFISEVIPIRYALASDMSSVLGNLGGGGGGGATAVGRSGPRTGATPAAGGTTAPGGYRPPGTTPGAPGTVNPLGGATTPIGTGGAAPGTTSSFSDRLQQIIRRASTTGEFQILGQTKIIADERTNSLLVFASRQDMEMIKDIISKLDVVMAQVLIESIIVDVSLNDSFDFGVSAIQNLRKDGNFVTGGGYVNSPLIGTNNDIASSLSSGLRFFAKYNEDWNVALSALASDSRARILQRPRIQTSHATPAQVFIGETVPYITSAYYGGFGGQPSASYQQLRVGIQLQVTPFINADGLVVMRIDQQIDEISGSIKIDNVGDVPTTTSRTFSAEVAVRDRESIILGGFIRSQNSKTTAGVPFLKEIPLLGYLFRSTSDQDTRRELLVLMRPTVLRTPEIASTTATAERRLMPGIHSAELEEKKAEAKRLKEAEGKQAHEFQPAEPQ